jgi:hypothetical protein
MSTLRDHLNSIIAKHTGAAVEEAIAAYKELISASFGPNSGSHRAAGRSPGRPAKSAVAASSRGGRRSSKQINHLVGQVHAFIKSHPGLRSEEIMGKMGGNKHSVKDALARLRATKKVKTKGIKRAMTYQVT